MKNLKSISCDPICGFEVRSHSTREAIDIAKKHAKDAHKMKASDSELKKMMKTI